MFIVVGICNIAIIVIIVNIVIIVIIVFIVVIVIFTIIIYCYYYGLNLEWVDSSSAHFPSTYNSWNWTDIHTFLLWMDRILQQQIVIIGNSETHVKDWEFHCVSSMIIQ